MKDSIPAAKPGPASASHVVRDAEPWLEIVCRMEDEAFVPAQMSAPEGWIDDSELVASGAADTHTVDRD